MISVIVPIYNVEKYLDRCIKSIVGQTYKNLEIILVDDGSTDGSFEICKNWASIDNRIIVIHKENGGVSSARNFGLDVAKGEYIAFVDSDDWFEPNMYEEMLSNAIKYDADCVFCSYKVLFENGTIKSVTPKKSGLVDRVDALEQLLLANKDADGYSGFSWNKLTRRDIISSHRFEPYTMCEDLLFFTDILNNCNRIFLNPTSFYTYYIREGSACHKKESNITRQRIDNLLSREALLKKIEKFPKLKKYVRAQLFSVGIDTLCRAYVLNYIDIPRYIYRLIYKCYVYYLFYGDSTIKRKAYNSMLFFLLLFHFPKKLVAEVFKCSNLTIDLGK